MYQRIRAFRNLWKLELVIRVVHCRLSHVNFQIFRQIPRLYRIKNIGIVKQNIKIANIYQFQLILYIDITVDSFSHYDIIVISRKNYSVIQYMQYNAFPHVCSFARFISFNRKMDVTNAMCILHKSTFCCRVYSIKHIRIYSIRHRFYLWLLLRILVMVIRPTEICNEDLRIVVNNVISGFHYVNFHITYVIVVCEIFCI